MGIFKNLQIAPRDRAILAILWASLALLLACSFQWGGDEAYLRWVAVFSFWMNLSLVILAAMAFVAAGMYNFGKGIIIQHTFVFGVDGPALPSGTDLHPDIAVFSLSPDETPEQLADRWEKAKAESMHRFAVLIGFRRPVGIIYGRVNGQEINITFTRDTPPYQGDDWPVKIAAPGTRFHAETWGQYQQYISVFCQNFPEWAETEKVLSAPEGSAAVTKVLRSMSRSVSVFLLCLFSALSLSAQKSVRVENYLGSVRYNSAPEAGIVKFIFRDAPIVRKSDGKLSYKEMLKAGDYFTDSDNAGPLLAIQVKTNAGVTKAIMPEAREASIQASPTSALPVQSSNIFADSMQAAIFAEKTKNQITETVQGVKRGITPMWNLAMWFFSGFLLPFLIGLAGLLRYVAKTAAGESAVNFHGVPILGPMLVSAHQWAAGLLMVISWVVIVTLLINAYLWLVYMGASMWIVLIAWAFILWFAETITNWIVPNMPVIGGGMTHQPNNFKRLG